MKRLIEGFSSLVKGTLSGFDRIVFKGLIQFRQVRLISG